MHNFLQTKWAFDAHADAHIFCNRKDFFCKLKRRLMHIFLWSQRLLQSKQASDVYASQ
jgi:hypothetical protein